MVNANLNQLKDFIFDLREDDQVWIIDLTDVGSCGKDIVEGMYFNKNTPSEQWKETWDILKQYSEYVVIQYSRETKIHPKTNTVFGVVTIGIIPPPDEI